MAVAGCAAPAGEPGEGASRSALEADDASIDVATTLQRISGFGASSAWTEPNIADELADALFSVDEGVGLSLLRIQIKPSGVTLEGETAIKASARGARVWAAPWSPPAAWKSPPAYAPTSAPTTHGGSLLLEHYQDWANQLAAVAQSMDEAGTPLLYISAQNEPAYETDQWDTCTYTPSALQTFVRDYLGPALDATGLPTRVLAPESQDWYSLADYAGPLLDDAETSPFVDVIATHGYGGQAYPYEAPAQNGKELWVTELDDGLHNPTYDPGMDSALVVAKLIHDGLTVASANAWHYWWITGNKDQPTNGALTDGTTLSRRAYVLGNFSKFVRPGFLRVKTGDAPSNGVSVSAFRDLKGTRVAIVAINPASTNLTQHFAINGGSVDEVTPWVTSDSLALEEQEPLAVSEGAFDYVLPARSVTSFVSGLSDVQAPSEPEPEPIDDVHPPEPVSTDTGLSCRIGADRRRSGAPVFTLAALLAGWGLRRRRRPK